MIADAVAKRVVDILESIEIDEQDGNRHLLSTSSRKHLLDAVENQGPVWKAGKNVVDRLIADLVHESGVVDGDGRLCRQTLEAIGEPGREGQTLRLGCHAGDDEPDRRAAHGDRCRYCGRMID